VRNRQQIEIDPPVISSRSLCGKAMFRGRRKVLPMKTRMKEYRARRDMTQADLADAVGVRRETIVFLERGRYNPSLKLAHAVARELGTTIDNLFLFEEDIDVVLEE
jgi:putative transcriptional regulator